MGGSNDVVGSPPPYLQPAQTAPPVPGYYRAEVGEFWISETVLSGEMQLWYFDVCVYPSRP